jgi:hypothetical protein
VAIYALVSTYLKEVGETKISMPGRYFIPGPEKLSVSFYLTGSSVCTEKISAENRMVVTYIELKASDEALFTSLPAHSESTL